MNPTITGGGVVDQRDLSPYRTNTNNRNQLTVSVTDFPVSSRQCNSVHPIRPILSSGSGSGCGRMLSGAGPRLALYRSNSDLDLDRHHLPAHYSATNLKNVNNSNSSTSLSLVRSNMGCFSRTTEFGSLTSIDVLEKGGGGGGQVQVNTKTSPNRLSFKKFLNQQPAVAADVGASASVRSESSSMFFRRRNKHDLGKTGTGSESSTSRCKPSFAHHDVQSLSANVGSARFSFLSQRRNTCTGASAASSCSSTKSGSEFSSSSLTCERLGQGQDGLEVEDDGGDGKGNALLLSCPFFRNEIGGEVEMDLSLSRHGSRSWHRPAKVASLSLLESQDKSHWTRYGLCPYNPSSNLLEAVDEGQNYYKLHFYQTEHENWFGSDDLLGPLAISIKRESGLVRVIIRSTELNTLRGCLQESGSRLTSKDIITHLVPQVNLSCFKLGVASTKVHDCLLKLDELGTSHKVKVGVLYCGPGQSTEEEMYNNQNGSDSFNEFLDLLGRKVKLKGFKEYTGGLDTRDDSTGLYSVHNIYGNYQLSFHVCAMLPFTPSNRQQLMRKRHIGNDIVTIVFQDAGAKPFTAKSIRSQFQHVFIIVRVTEPCSDGRTTYSVSVSRSKDVPLFGPAIKHSSFLKGAAFAQFLLAKVINAENATHRSEKFTNMATRTRLEYLKDLVINYCSGTSLDRPRFSLFNKKEVRPEFDGGVGLDGAIAWSVTLQQEEEQDLDLVLALSRHSLVLVQRLSKEAVFGVPTDGVLGWCKDKESLRIFFHQGECLSINSSIKSDLDEIQLRLTHVTKGCHTVQLGLQRNQKGQLGFHVQADGLVTDVEVNGYADKVGLSKGSRLVQICSVPVCTLTQSQMIDLLKKSEPVVIQVIPALNGCPRLGCDSDNCPYLLQEGGATGRNGQHSQAQPGSQQKRFVGRSSSPPRSSNSSGYGTGSSSRSFIQEPNMNRPCPTISPPPIPARDRSFLIYTKCSGSGVANENGNEIQRRMSEDPFLQHHAKKLNPTLSSSSMKNLVQPSKLNPTHTSPSIKRVAPNSEESTLFSRVTYLTDFPVSSDLPQSPSPSLERVDVNQKEARLAGLKAAGLLRKNVPVKLSSRNRSSTLQEDLIRLISDSSDCLNNNRSLEPQSGKSTNSSPVRNGFVQHRLGPRPVSCHLPNSPSVMCHSDDPELDWPGLVEKAKEFDICDQSVQNAQPEFGITSDLEARLTQLEERLKLEQESKNYLAEQIQNLKMENVRLRRESMNQQEFNKFKQWLLTAVQEKRDIDPS